MTGKQAGAKRRSGKKSANPMRSLPAVDAILRSPAAAILIREHGRPMVAGAVRSAIAGIRDAMASGNQPAPADVSPAAVLDAASAAIGREKQPNLRRVVNATGIILHTGLGRAVLPRSVRDALPGLMGCCNLQLNLETGKRGRREECLRDLVRRLTGAEETLLVNNCAAATFLMLRALARDREVIVSRGELIEIGGSFRLPDIMTESGAILREVGTTNKTHEKDYENAVGPNTALILKAHKSNYSIVGFTKEVGIGAIAAIGRKHGVPVVDDLGCGALVGLERYGLPHEPTVRESLEAGADIVLFSTDKLIGGPQGGMLAGRKELLDRVKAHPLYRTFRVCKLTLSAVEATLRLFLDPDRLAETNPTYAMMAEPLDAVRKKALRLRDLLSAARPDWKLEVVDTPAYLGGGALPMTEISSCAVSISAGGRSTEETASELRHAAVPIVPRISDDAVLLDMRTVDESDMALIRDACAGIGALKQGHHGQHGK